MIICFKKRILLNLMFAIFLMCGLYFNFTTKNKVVSVSTLPVSDMTVIIDAGHGTPDGGAVGSRGTVEKDLNLIISKKLGSFFQKTGAKVIYTREDDFTVAKNKTNSLRKIKNEDLKARVEIINSNNADILISIHMNNFENPKYSGAQVFYESSQPQNKVLAESIQNSIRKNLQNNNQRKAKEAQGDIYILKNSQITSVMVECGFLSNPEEEKQLLNDVYQNEIAFAIFLGTLDYLS